MEKVLEKIQKAGLLGISNTRWGYTILYDYHPLDKYPLTHIGLEIETGGARGGSCWGDEAHGYSSSEVLETDKIILGLMNLGLVDENMTVKQLIQFKDKFVKFERTESEYYGNYTEYLFVGVPVTITEDGELKLCE